MAVVREVQDEVGYQSLAVVALETLATAFAERLLRVVLLALLQFQVLQQLLQLQLTEVALHLHLSRQGTCQSVGRLADGSTFLHTDLDGFVQTRQRLRLLLLGLVQRLLHVLQTLL